MVRLIGTPGGITPPGAERSVFRLVVIVGAVLVVAAVIFMLWQDFHPAAKPIQHFPVPESGNMGKHGDRRDVS